MKTNWTFVLCALGQIALGCGGQAESELSGKLRDESLAEPKEGTNTDPITMMQVNVSAKMAMTWTLLGSVQPNTGNAYVLIGSDAKTNAYTGDTSTLDVLPVLCINKNAPTHPGSAIWGPKQTPGGAWRQTWSGGTVALTAPVQGVSLTSRAAADALCSSEFGAGYRIAEFHDGDPNRWSGWDFWGAALNTNLCSFQGARFWVAINDQDANPW